MNVWDWNSPIALSIFAVGITLSLLLLTFALKTLASIGNQDANRRR
jgi:hypothetical protein